LVAGEEFHQQPTTSYQQLPFPRMPLTALLILLASAVLHSIWNLLVKRSFDKQVFLWLAVVVSAVMLLPTLIWFGQSISTTGWLILIGSAVLEVIYYLLLGAAYQGGDLSLVYPVTRGSVPLFVTILAVLFLGESITLIGVIGIALTIAGIYVLHLRSLHKRDILMPLRAFAGRNFHISLLTAISTALYTVVDKVGVTYVNPTAYITWLFLLCGVMLAPFMLIRRKPQVITELKANPGTILIVGVLFAASYWLVLLASTLSKVSYLSSVRGISIVFGAIIGAVMLREGLGRIKLLGAAVIFAGMICIGLAG